MQHLLLSWTILFPNLTRIREYVTCSLSLANTESKKFATKPHDGTKIEVCMGRVAYINYACKNFCGL